MIDWQRLIPGYWLQNLPTSTEWDAILNDLMNTFPEPTSVGLHTVDFNKVTVWVRNYPYAYGYIYSSPIGRIEVLPRVATRKRLKAYLGNIQYTQLRKLFNDD